MIKKEEIIEEVKNDWKMFEDHDPEYAIIDYDHKKVGDLLELIDKTYEAGQKAQARKEMPDTLEYDDLKGWYDSYGGSPNWSSVAGLIARKVKQERQRILDELEDKEIIQEFINGTDKWLEVIPQKEVCNLCGIDPNKMQELQQELDDVKELLDKGLHE